MMNNPAIDKHFEDPATFLHSFMDEMPGLFKIYSDKNVIYLPAQTGTGFSRIFHLEDGLTVRNMDFSLIDDFEFIRLARKAGEEKTFQLYYFLDNHNFHFSLNDDKELLCAATFSNVLLISNDILLRGRFEVKEKVRVVVISFSLSWLQRNGLAVSDAFKPFVPLSNQRDTGILLMQYPDATDYHIVSEINKLHIPNNDDAFAIKVNTLTLVKRFFEAINARKNINIKQSRPDYFLRMVSLEEKICKYIPTALPSIKELAKEFHMSETNLKKHFHMVYGKNIYGYYLDKKMVMAKDLLMNDDYSVSKIAYSLGYEKVASFSKVFKKMFGVLPSVMKHEQKTVRPRA